MQEFVKVNEELADRSAVYLAMWKALEAFDPKVDRWSEPVSFGSQKERTKAAEDAISRFNQRHPNASHDDLDRDIPIYRTHLDSLAKGLDYTAQVAEFASYVRSQGSRLADGSVSVGKSTGVR